MSPTVSLCIFVHNDLPMLKATLLHERKWVDQICILDLFSTDGTRQFCESWLDPDRDRYEYRHVNTCPINGFAEAKNHVCAMAECDWVMASGADTVMDWTQQGRIKEVLGATGADILSIETINVLPFGKCQPSEIERAALFGGRGKAARHRVFVRRGSGIEYKGWMHEEPYRGEVNCAAEAPETDLRRFHFEGWGDEDMRQMRYAWMLKRAMEKPELQAWTNRYWYEVFWPANEGLLRENARRYEESGMG